MRRVLAHVGLERDGLGGVPLHYGMGQADLGIKIWKFTSSSTGRGQGVALEIRTSTALGTKYFRAKISHISNGKFYVLVQNYLFICNKTFFQK